MTRLFVIGILPIERPSDVDEQEFSKLAALVYHYGHSSPGPNIKLYHQLISKLAELFHERCSVSTKSGCTSSQRQVLSLYLPSSFVQTWCFCCVWHLLFCLTPLQTSTVGVSSTHVVGLTDRGTSRCCISQRHLKVTWCTILTLVEITGILAGMPYNCYEYLI